MELAPLPWAADYLVSDDGRVFSRARNYAVGQRELKQQSRREGDYLSVRLQINGQRRMRFVHRLVLEAFRGPSPEGLESRHLDGDRTNNHLSNLVWGTSKENAADRERHGRTARGVHNGQARLSERDVERIVELRSSGIKQREIADKIGVSQITISRVLRGVYWAHRTDAGISDLNERTKRRLLGRAKEQNGRAKLNQATVQEIRRIYKNGGTRQVDLANSYGVTQTQISRIIRGERW